ncbi:uncharacterized protein LOC117725900 [Cyclopterus lumpus]|uniref:uncharacterized protein LOC117725900 n=1 Tax=Cyclopterus lumpus TaxID=8103 RepID=UPI0014867B01|nr:uncharacterized protein LOC117725900 [Cyclopterus lumpus]
MFFDEPGELRCSDLEVPLLTSKSLKEVVMLHLKYITEEQWALLAGGQVDPDTALLLSVLCLNIVERVYNLVLEVVASQVYDWALGQSSDARASGHSSASVPMIEIESPRQEWNFHTVTEEDMQASLGDSLHRCLGETLDVASERSDHSEQLLLLVAEEVANKVNRKLADVTQTNSSRQLEVSSESAPLDMVHHVAKILESCLAQNFTLKSTSSPNEDSMEEEFSTDVTEGSLTPVSPSSWEKEFSQGEKIFVAVFLSKLLDHLAHSTNTSLLDLDLDRAFNNLKKTLGGTGFTLPQTVGNLHRTIFTKLCREFGSAKLLRAAAVSGGTAFGEAVARELKGQLQKASRKPLSVVDRLRRYFRRKSSKLAPACEVRTFSVKTRVLGRLFTCHCGGSEED